ncbi:variable large family protein [Borrelia hispanica]|uniref:variable large family protein n=1 Tax=Borrelia hispanica TaxID=40835 RepID=UPI001F1A6083|nr:variable large family protein [Borrelia hispanica]
MMVMVMMVVMGCNNGMLEEEKGKNKFLKSLVSLGNEFLDVFTSFGEMVGSVLGLNLESKKSDVGNYFKKVQDTVQGIKDGLNKIVSDMKKEKNPNAEATESAVKTLVESKLDKIIGGAKEVSEAIGDASDPIGNVADKDAAAAVVGDSVKSLIEGIEKIVSVVLGKEGNPEAGDAKKVATVGNGNRGAASDGEAGKLFTANAGTADNAKKSVADAAKAVGAVTGADILQAIVKGDGDATAAKLASAKDGTIAGAMALRAMAKGGKFAGPNDNNNADYTAEIKGVALSSVIKALDTLTIAIRSTIDEGHKSVKEAMKINTNDTPVASEKSGSGDQNK